MNSLLIGRRFQLWEFRVSHSSLLLRSPKEDLLTENIDVIFVGVEFVSVPTYLGEISIEEPSGQEIYEIGKNLRKKINKENIFIIKTDYKRYSIVALQIKIESNDSDYFSSPFEFPKL